MKTQLALASLLTLATPASALVVDVCQGGDFHTTGTTAAINTISISKQGTYTPDVDGFGCHNDTPDTVLGTAGVIDQFMPSDFIAEQVFFNFTAGPKKGQIVIAGAMASGLARNGGCLTVDLPIVGGSGAFAGLRGVAHITDIGEETCEIRFSTR